MFYLNDFISYYEYLLHYGYIQFNKMLLKPQCNTNQNVTQIGAYFLSSKTRIVKLYTKELRKLSILQLLPTLLSHPLIFNFTFFLPSQYLEIYNLNIFSQSKTTSTFSPIIVHSCLLAGHYI